MPADYSRSACPVCASEHAWIFLERKRTPVCQNLLLASYAEARDQPVGCIAMALCGNCGMAYNRCFQAALVPYGPGYVNAQTASPAFERYRRGLVHYFLGAGNVRDRRIAEIGCGDGWLLRELVNEPRAKNTGLGLDPAYVGPKSETGGRLRFRAQAFGPGVRLPAVDVVICRQVIEHLADPVTFLAALRKSIDQRLGVRVFFETSCLRWILRNRVVWDFYYEHCSMFTAATLRRTFETAGFAPVRTWHAFGGAYLWIEAQTAGKVPVRAQDKPVAILAGDYHKAEVKFLKDWSRRLNRSGVRAAALWGAGAKGVTFASLFDPERRWLDCVVDGNAGKQGRFLPLTGHEVVAPGELVGRGIKNIIVTNPQYVGEVRSRVRELGLKCRVIGPHTA